MVPSEMSREGREQKVRGQKGIQKNFISKTGEHSQKGKVIVSHEMKEKIASLFVLVFLTQIQKLGCTIKKHLL